MPKAAALLALLASARGAELEPDADAVEALLADPAAFEWVGVTELYDESW